jgi:hypothetical protein
MARKAKLGLTSPKQDDLILPHFGGQEQLPSPKRNALRTKARNHLPWETNYAAFSLDFAIAAVKKLSPTCKNVIYDPFVGSGTTLDAALIAGIKSFGIELNPYNALLSRCRIALHADFDAVNDLLKSASKNGCEPIRESKEILQPDSTSPIDALINIISKRINCPQNKLVTTLCADSSDQHDNEVVALVSALHAARKGAHVHFGSNPAWLKLGVSPDYKTQPTQCWLPIALEVADTIVTDLATRCDNSRPETTVFPGAFQDSPIKGRRISRFLTSPPYLNRLDYVNPTLPELYGLGIHEEEHIEALRTRMMGTTKMRPQMSEMLKLPSQAVTNLLKDIANHPTKASSTYYYRFYQQYFSDLFAFLVWLERHTTIKCEGIVVLQDSFYKEIKVPIANIITELAETLGFTVSILLEESRSRHMGQISPRQRAHAPSKLLTEYTLLFQR